MIKEIFAKVFPSEDRISSVIESAKEGLDYSFFTAEEKSKAALKAHELSIKLYDALVPFNTAMRHIAFSVAIIWGLYLLLMTLVGLLKISFYVDCKAIMTELINPNFTLVMQFYFGSAAANGFARTIIGGIKK